MSFSMLALMIVGGLGLALQAAMNTRLRVGVQSPALSALISFLVGGVALALVTLSGVLGRGRWPQSDALPWWAWLGGLLGAFYVTATVVAVPRIGAALMIACTVLGQLVAALALDQFGWLGVPRIPFSPWRALGAILLFAGVLLMQHRR